MLNRKSLNMILLLSSIFVFSACIEQEEVPITYVDPNASTEINSGNNDTGQNDDHSSDGDEVPPSELGLNATFSEINVVSELSQKKIIRLNLSKTSYFEPASVSFEVDMASVNAVEVDTSDYISASFSASSVNLTNATTGYVDIEIDVNSMAPSFSAKQIKVKLVSDQGAAGIVEKIVSFNLQVIPRITIGIISDAVPHGYTHEGQTYLRSHAGDGVQVVFKNQTMTFGTNNDGPCIHTSSPMKHCTTSNRMEPGEEYLPPKVTAAQGYAKPAFYNHFNGNDSIGRRIHFNVVPGDEDNL